MYENTGGSGCSVTGSSCDPVRMERSDMGPCGIEQRVAFGHSLLAGESMVREAALKGRTA